MECLLKTIRNWINYGSYHNQMDRYIESRRPTNTAEVEQYMREFCYQEPRGSL